MGDPEVEGRVFWTLVWSVLTIFGTLFVASHWKIRRAIKRFERNHIPFRKPLPLFGNMLPVLRKKISFAEFVAELHKEFPKAKYSGALEFATPMYILRDTELIKSITVKNFDHFSDHKAFIDESVDPLFGGNLFAIKGERWKEMRSIVSPVFTSSKMRAMFALISKCAENFASYLENQDQPLTLEMKDAFTRYTNDVIATAAFGINVDSLVNRDNEFYMMGKDATSFRGLKTFKMFLFRFSPGLMKFFRQKFMSTKVSRFFCDLVKETVLNREKNQINRPDLIHQLMQARHKESDEKLTIAEITSQAFIFFFAGFETVSTLMCFASHQLAVHPDIQDKLVAEIDAAFDEEGEKLSYEKVNHLKYLEMFLNETLRYYPPAPFTDRVNTQKFELPPADESSKPVLIEPGTRFWIPTYGLHHDPNHFPDPEKFDPERFSPENKGSIDHFAYLPFGAGPRNCPGNRFALMETKLVLCHILRKFRIRKSSKTHIPLVLSKNSATMSAEHGFWLDFESRIR